MPSQRSCEERISSPTPASAGAALDDPLADDRMAMHEAPLLLVQRPRLVEDRLGDRDLADVVKLGGAAERLDLVLGQVEHDRERPHELGDLADVIGDVGEALRERA